MTLFPPAACSELDRKLPFSVVCRQPPNRVDADTFRLALGEASCAVALQDEVGIVGRTCRSLSLKL